jgi:hypothetical protein
MCQRWRQMTCPDAPVTRSHAPVPDLPPQWLSARSTAGRAHAQAGEQRPWAVPEHTAPPLMPRARTGWAYVPGDPPAHPHRSVAEELLRHTP